jgi:hypothetical protein
MADAAVTCERLSLPIWRIMCAQASNARHKAVANDVSPVGEL